MNWNRNDLPPSLCIAGCKIEDFCKTRKGTCTELTMKNGAVFLGVTFERINGESADEYDKFLNDLTSLGKKYLNCDCVYEDYLLMHLNVRRFLFPLDGITDPAPAWF